jgi:hypothetical protein
MCGLSRLLDIKIRELVITIKVKQRTDISLFRVQRYDKLLKGKNLWGFF